MDYLTRLPKELRSIIDKYVYPIKICVNILVRNDAENVHECLDSIKGIADAIIIGDVGSVDNTLEICESFRKESGILMRTISLSLSLLNTLYRSTNISLYRSHMLKESRGLIQIMDPNQSYTWYMMNVEVSNTYMVVVTDIILFKEELLLKQDMFKAIIDQENTVSSNPIFWHLLYNMSTEYKWGKFYCEYATIEYNLIVHTLSSVELKRYRK